MEANYTCSVYECSSVLYTPSEDPVNPDTGYICYACHSFAEYDFGKCDKGACYGRAIKLEDFNAPPYDAGDEYEDEDSTRMPIADRLIQRTDAGGIPSTSCTCCHELLREDEGIACSGGDVFCTRECMVIYYDD
jgi:hypothetical protein